MITYYTKEGKFLAPEGTHPSNKQLHREKGPAVIYKGKSSISEWWQNGKKHRLDGPALVCRVTNYQEWWRKGQLHREDGPAIIFANGDTEWWYNGLKHRKGGPAIVYSAHVKEWWENGLLHRLTGPAVDFVNGDKKYWIKGVDVTAYVKKWVADTNIDLSTSTGKILFKLKFG